VTTRNEVHSYLDPAVLARLEGLSLQARRVVEGRVTGGHRSPDRGFSAEFAEHREYSTGDDLRYVDWKVYGRSDRFYLKQFEDETNFACWLVLDTSESMAYRSTDAPASKLDLARGAVASLAWLVLRQRDAVGLATLSGSLHHVLPPSTQASHLDQIGHLLREATPTGPTALGIALDDLANRITRRSLVILISDLFDDLDRLTAGLKHLAWRGHDVAVLQVIDPAEEDFPFEDPTRFVGLEGEPDQVVEPRVLGDAYRAEFRSFLASVTARCRGLQMDHMVLRTDLPLDITLTRFLENRKRSR